MKPAGNRFTNILILAPGLLLGCCWIPKGISGLLTLIHLVNPHFRLPEGVGQLLQLWSDPLGWYAHQLFRHVRQIDPRALACLSALPNCLCGLVAVALILLVIVLAARAAGRQKLETPARDDLDT
jgi:hypothetical protein